MKLSKIHSADLPEIDNSVKECINLGQWFLFKSSALGKLNEDAVFYLKAGALIFELNNNGAVLKELEQRGSNFSFDELFYFSDLPQPQSLSNMKISYS